MGQALFLTNLLEYGIDIQTLLDLPHAFTTGGRTDLERWIPDAVARTLMELDHAVAMINEPHGDQAIWIDQACDMLIDGSDAKDGMAMEY